MKSFCRLKFGEKFEVNEVVYQKETASTAVRALGTRADWPGDAPLYLRFWPWTKVETCEFPVPPLIQMLRRDSKRNAAAIARVLAVRSPFLGLLTSGTFPKGQRILAEYHKDQKPYDPETLMNTPYTGYNTPEKFDPRKHICFSDKYHDDNRTGPSA